MDFNSYYLQHFGESLWPQILASIQKEESQTSFVSPWTSWTYRLDLASIIGASLLRALPGEKIFDMCAAPGGKSLVLSLAMQARGELWLGDLSPDRNKRLHRVIREFLGDKMDPFIRWKSGDSGRFATKVPEYFDAILLDAPCSNEGHLIREGRTKEWSEKNSDSLSRRQFALATAAMYMLKPGGRLIYSTCSLSPIENRDTIQKLLERCEKKKISVEVEDLSQVCIGIPQGLGQLMLPVGFKVDIADAAFDTVRDLLVASHSFSNSTALAKTDLLSFIGGPIFVCSLRKK